MKMCVKWEWSKPLRTCFSMILTYQTINILWFSKFGIKLSFTKGTGGSGMLILHDFHLKGFPFMLCGEETAKCNDQSRMTT